MHWTAWVLLALVALNGGWMLADGVRALAVGDYFTPRSGPHAGQLGPWARVATAVGIGPRSATMKWTFVVYGALYLAATLALLGGVGKAWWAVLALAILGLWHLPFGTLVNVAVIALLFHPALRGLS